MPTTDMFGLMKRDKWMASLNILLFGLFRIGCKRMQHDFMDSTPFHPISHPPLPWILGRMGWKKSFASLKLSNDGTVTLFHSVILQSTLLSIRYPKS